MKNVSLFFRVCVSSHLGLFSSTGSSAAIAKLWTNMTFVQMMLVLVMIFKLMTMWAFWWHLERQMTIMMNVSKAFWQTTQWITFRTLKKGISANLYAGRNDWYLKQNLRRCRKNYLDVGLHQFVICHWLKMRWKRWLEAKRRLKSTPQLPNTKAPRSGNEGRWHPTNGNQEKEQRMLRRRALY